MSKTLSTALKNHLAGETSTTTVCIAMKLHWRAIPVSGITKANPAVITSQYEHALITGQYVAFDDIVGMTELNDSAHTQPFKFYTVTVLTDTTFEIDVDSTAFTTYVSGGIIREVMAFTDSTAPVLLDNISYTSSEAFTRSAVVSESSLSVDTIDLTGLIGLAASGLEITVGDVVAGRFDMAELRVFLVNYEDLTMGRMWLRRGWIGDVSTTDIAYTAEVRGMAQMLQVQTLELYTASCRFDLGDSRCGFDLTGNLPDTSAATVTGTVTTVVDRFTFDDTVRSEVDNIFNFGYLTFTSGSNTGLGSIVKDYTFISSQFVLQDAMPFEITTGDAYSVYKGCDKSFISHCKDKFDNVINFGGFPHLPGEDRLIQVIQAKDPSTNL